VNERTDHKVESSNFRCILLTDSIGYRSSSFSVPWLLSFERSFQRRIVYYDVPVNLVRTSLALRSTLGAKIAHRKYGRPESGRPTLQQWSERNIIKNIRNLFHLYSLVRGQYNIALFYQFLAVKNSPSQNWRQTLHKSRYFLRRHTVVQGHLLLFSYRRCSSNFWPEIASMLLNNSFTNYCNRRTIYFN